VARGGFETGSTVAVDVPGLAEQIRSGEVRVLDVRDEDEWEESHVPGSIHIPFHELRDGVPAELENGGKPLAIVCSAGNRSSIAASLLKRAGLEASSTSPTAGSKTSETKDRAGRGK
jgi:rhodanese-related sulfurtransferase